MRAIDADALITQIVTTTEESCMYAAWKQGMNYAIGLVEAQPTIQPEPHWIPVAQALPEDDTVVLVCGKSGGIYTAIHNNSKTWIRGWWKMNSKNHHCNPIAWMSLPEPFKEVTEWKN